MKKYNILLITLLIASMAFSQKFPKGWQSNPATTAEIQATANPIEGLNRLNSDTNTIWSYIGGQWRDTGGTGGGTITLDNALSNTSTNAVENQAIKNGLDTKQGLLTGNESVFDGWDKNASDDFDGAYSSLSGIPAVQDGSETIVTAGANITVTGTGTGADPYVITSTGGSGGSINLPYVFVEHDGVTTDYSSAIQAALDMGGYILLDSNKNYPISTRLDLNKSNTTFDLNGSMIYSSTTFRFMNFNEDELSDFSFKVKNGKFESTVDNLTDPLDLFGFLTIDNNSIDRGVFEDLTFVGPTAHTTAIKTISQTNNTVFRNLSFIRISVLGMGGIGIETISSTATHVPTNYNNFLYVEDFYSENTGTGSTEGMGISLVTNTHNILVNGAQIKDYYNIGLEMAGKYARVNFATITDPKVATHAAVYTFARSTSASDTSPNNFGVIFDNLNIEGGRLNLISRDGNNDIKVINSTIYGTDRILGENVEYINTDINTSGNIESTNGSKVTFTGGKINFDAASRFQPFGHIYLKDLDITRVNNADGTINDGQMGFFANANTELFAENVNFNDGYLNAGSTGTIHLKNSTYTRASTSNVFLGAGTYDLNNVTVNGVEGHQLDASGFDGILSITDDTLQEVAQKVDNLSGAGSGISDIIEDTTPQLGGNLDLNGNLIEGGGSINISGSATMGSHIVSGGAFHNTPGSIATVSNTGGFGWTANNTFAFKQSLPNPETETFFDFSALTQDRTITFPDADVDLGALSSGGGTTYTAGTGIDISGSTLSVSQAFQDLINGAVQTTGTQSITGLKIFNELPRAGIGINPTTLQQFVPLGFLMNNFVAGSISSRTGTNVIAMQLETQAETDANPAIAANEIVICSDCSPMTVQTGNAFEVDDFRGIDDRANDTATFTFSNVEEGAVIQIEADRSTDATYTGITFVEHPKSDGFVADVEQLIQIQILPSGRALRLYSTIE